MPALVDLGTLFKYHKPNVRHIAEWNMVERRTERWCELYMHASLSPFPRACTAEMFRLGRKF
jgi:hypothetical protein